MSVGCCPGRTCGTTESCRLGRSRPPPHHGRLPFSRWGAITRPGSGSPAGCPPELPGLERPSPATGQRRHPDIHPHTACQVQWALRSPHPLTATLTRCTETWVGSPAATGGTARPHSCHRRSCCRQNRSLPLTSFAEGLTDQPGAIGLAGLLAAAPVPRPGPTASWSSRASGQRQFAVRTGPLA